MNGLVVWLTGLPGSGKSTLAEGIKGLFPAFTILRLDEARKILTPEPDYSEHERELVYRSIVYTAKVLSELGHPVIIDATANRRRWRELARQLIPAFAEIYLICPLPVCEQREMTRKDTHGAPTGIYRKGAAGSPVPGVQVPYEEPPAPELVIETEREAPENALNRVRELIISKAPSLVPA
jgi:adenylylsulfate kinase